MRRNPKLNETILVRRLLPRIMAAGFVCIALATPAAAAEGKRLTSENEFRGLVVDRQLKSERSNLLYAGDGRMMGTSRDKRVEGTWSWVGADLCRTATWGARNLGYECLAVFVIGDLVILARDQGRGRAFALRFSGVGSQPVDSQELLACFC